MLGLRPSLCMYKGAVGAFLLLESFFKVKLKVLYYSHKMTLVEKQNQLAMENVIALIASEKKGGESEKTRDSL